MNNFLINKKVESKKLVSCYYDLGENCHIDRQDNFVYEGAVYVLTAEQKQLIQSTIVRAVISTLTIDLTYSVGQSWSLNSTRNWVLKQIHNIRVFTEKLMAQEQPAIPQGDWDKDNYLWGTIAHTFNVDIPMLPLNHPAHKGLVEWLKKEFDL